MHTRRRLPTEAAPPPPTHLRIGQVYVGHSAKGYGRPELEAEVPLYLIVMREPTSLWRSLFSYVASHPKHPQYEESRDLNAQLIAAGVAPDRLLDHELLEGKSGPVA